MGKRKATVLNLSRFSRKRDRQRSATSMTALDWDGTTLRVVQSTLRGGVPTVSSVTSHVLTFATDADRADAGVLGRSIGEALERGRIKPMAVVMAVPRSQVVLRTMLLPVVEDLRELASLVHMQVMKDLPFKISEAVIDFKINREIAPAVARGAGEAVGGGGGASTAAATAAAAEPAVASVAPKLEVLIAVVKSEVVAFYNAVAAAAGVKLKALGLSSQASARCVQACGVAEKGGSFALVTLRTTDVGIDIVADGVAAFSRGAVLKAGADNDAAGSMLKSVTIEVVRSLRSFTGSGAQAAMTQVFVTGATGSESALTGALGEALETPVNLLDAGVRLGLADAAKGAADGAVAGIGLALGALDPTSLPLDFLNPKRPAVERDMRRIRILIALAGVGCVCLLAAGVRSWLVTKRQKVLTALNAEVDEAEKKRGIYRRMIQQASVVSEWVKGERDWLDHYAYLSSVLPPSEEVHITSFAVTGQRALRLAVQARSGEILAKVEKQLRAAGYEVRPLSITPGTDRNGYDFRSNVELLVPDKLKIDLTKVRAPERPSDDSSLDPIVRKGGG